MIFEITFAVFLAIFTLTAVITLLSLAGLLRMEREYKRSLFRVLVLQVVACVVGFAATGVKLYYQRGAPLTKEELLSSSWSWRYNNWYTVGGFAPAGDEVVFRANTSWISANPPRDPVIIRWEGLPFTPDGFSPSIEFSATMTYTEYGGTVEPVMRSAVGKPREVKVRLERDLSLKGSWTLDDRPERAGMLFQRQWN